MAMLPYDPTVSDPLTALLTGQYGGPTPSLPGGQSLPGGPPMSPYEVLAQQTQQTPNYSSLPTEASLMPGGGGYQDEDGFDFAAGADNPQADDLTYQGAPPDFTDPANQDAGVYDEDQPLSATLLGQPEGADATPGGADAAGGGGMFPDQNETFQFGDAGTVGGGAPGIGDEDAGPSISTGYGDTQNLDLGGAAAIMAGSPLRPRPQAPILDPKTLYPDRKMLMWEALMPAIAAVLGGVFAGKAGITGALQGGDYANKQTNAQRKEMGLYDFHAAQQSYARDHQLWQDEKQQLDRRTQVLSAFGQKVMGMKPADAKAYLQAQRPLWAAQGIDPMDAMSFASVGADDKRKTEIRKAVSEQLNSWIAAAKAEGRPIESISKLIDGRSITIDGVRKPMRVWMDLSETPSYDIPEGASTTPILRAIQNKVKERVAAAEASGALVGVNERKAIELGVWDEYKHDERVKKEYDALKLEQARLQQRLTRAQIDRANDPYKGLLRPQDQTYALRMATDFKQNGLVRQFANMAGILRELPRDAQNRHAPQRHHRPDAARRVHSVEAPRQQPHRRPGDHSPGAGAPLRPADVADDREGRPRGAALGRAEADDGVGAQGNLRVDARGGADARGRLRPQDREPAGRSRGGLPAEPRHRRAPGRGLLDSGRRRARAAVEGAGRSRLRRAGRRARHQARRGEQAARQPRLPARGRQAEEPRAEPEQGPHGCGPLDRLRHHRRARQGDGEARAD